MLKKKSLAMAVIALLLVLSTSLSCVIEIVVPAEGPEPEPGPITGRTTNMNRDEKIATVTTGGQGAILQGQGIKVEFSGKALPPGVTVNAYSVKDAEKNYPGGWLTLAGPVFDIDVGGQALGDMVRVTLPYDAARLGSADPKSLFGLSWNGINWDQHSSTVDTTNRTVSFFADHFSEVGTGGERLILTPEGFDARADLQPGTHTTAHFTISYEKAGPDAPLSAPAYHKSSIETLDVPPYVQDLGVFLEDAYKRLGRDGLGYNSPPAGDVIRVRVCALKPGLHGDAPVTPGTYDIYIDNRMMTAPDKDDPTAIPELLPPDAVWKRLKVAAGHELFHVFQDYNSPFPTWFCEASAAYIEWRLYYLEFPNDFADEHLTGSLGHPQFLYHGMFSSNKYDWYSWGAFLIYLQQLYLKQWGDGGNEYTNRDILHDAIFNSGQSGSRAAADLRDDDMTPVLLLAAQRAFNFKGTWSELLANFSQAYYVDHEKWPGLEQLITDSKGMTNSLTTPIAHYNLQYEWNAGNFRGPNTFPVSKFPFSSSILWHISGHSAQKIFGTLVITNTQLKPETQFKYVAKELPKYWVYTLSVDKNKITGVLGPLDLIGANPTVPVDHFGNGKGGLVGEVYLVGVSGSMDPDLWSCPNQFTAYLLPPPTSLTVEPVQVTEGGKQVDKLRVSWTVDTDWVNSAISKEFGGFTHEVRDASGKILVSIPIEQGNSVDITPQPNMTTISVVLVDSYKNEGPPAIAEAPQPTVPPVPPTGPAIDLSKVEWCEVFIACIGNYPFEGNPNYQEPFIFSLGGIIKGKMVGNEFTASGNQQTGWGKEINLTLTFDSSFKQITSYSISVSSSLNEYDPDGNIWYTENESVKIKGSTIPYYQTDTSEGEGVFDVAYKYVIVGKETCKHITANQTIILTGNVSGTKTLKSLECPDDSSGINFTLMQANPTQ